MKLVIKEKVNQKSKLMMYCKTETRKERKLGFERVFLEDVWLNLAGAPYTAKTSLAFCCYNGSVCCSSKDDQQLQKQFKAMNPSDAGCASVLKSILCAEIY